MSEVTAFAVVSKSGKVIEYTSRIPYQYGQVFYKGNIYQLKNPLPGMKAKRIIMLGTGYPVSNKKAIMKSPRNSSSKLNYSRMNVKTLEQKDDELRTKVRLLSYELRDYKNDAAKVKKNQIKIQIIQTERDEIRKALNKKIRTYFPEFKDRLPLWKNDDYDGLSSRLGGEQYDEDTYRRKSLQNPDNKEYKEKWDIQHRKILVMESILELKRQEKIKFLQSKVKVGKQLNPAQEDFLRKTEGKYVPNRQLRGTEALQRQGGGTR